MLGARALLGLSFAGFVALGMPEGALGVAWPSMQQSFERSLGELGLLLAIYTAGYLTSTVSTGWLAARVELGLILTSSSSLAATALLTYAVTGTWPGLVVATAVLGFAGGLIDAGMNAYTALRHGGRVMNLLHAAFGLGATVGPLLMTAAIEVTSWQSGYVVLAMVQAVLAAGFWTTRSRWALPESRRAGRSSAPADVPVLLASLVVFLVYTGVEAAAGQWAFSLLTRARGFDPVPAGLLVTGYWGSLTLGRLATAAVGHRRSPESLVLAGMAGATAGGVLLWIEPSRWLGAAGLLIIGLSLAPIFPLLTLLTPRRLGAEFAASAIGFQLAAASLGGAIVPGTLGFAVERFGVDSLGPGIAGWAAVMFVSGLWLSVIVQRRGKIGPAS